MLELKFIGRAIAGLFKQAWRRLQFGGSAVTQKWRRMPLNPLETERLDRLRNPSKYRGR